MYVEASSVDALYVALLLVRAAHASPQCTGGRQNAVAHAQAQALTRLAFANR